MTFQAPKNIPGLDSEPNRALVKALGDIQRETDALGAAIVLTDVKTTDYVSQLGEHVQTNPPAAGLRVLLPTATVENQGGRVTIAVLSVTSGGAVTVAVVDQQLISGAATKVLTVACLVTFESLGVNGWSVETTGTLVPPVALTDLATQAANTVVANATAGVATPTAFPVGTNTVLGRVAGNIVAAQLVGAQVAAATLTNALLATMAANTIKANATAGVATPTDVQMANAESVFGRTSGNLQAIDSAVQTAFIRAAGSIFWAAAAANQVLRRAGAGDLGFGTLVDGNIGANQISAASQAQMAANSVKANATAGVANEADLAVGTNAVVGRVAGNIVAAALVNAQIAANTITHASEAQPAANTIVGNPTAGAANLQDIALAAQSILLRAAANIVNATAIAAQFLGRSLAGGDLSFQLKGLVSSNTTQPSASAATTNLSCGGSFSIPASTLGVGDVYRITGEYFYLHAAATTPTITMEFLLAGSVVAAVTLVNTPIATASNYTGTLIYTLRVQTTGAGGTCAISLDQKNTYVTFARASIENVPVGSAPGTTAINTTAANTIEARIRMTTAVASNTLTVTQGFIEKL